MADQEVYNDLLTRIIENEQSFYGNLAIDILRKVNGLDISDEGKVLTMSGDFKSTIYGIITEYKKFDGDLSLNIIKNIIEAYRSSYPGVDFPVI